MPTVAQQPAEGETVRQLGLDNSAHGPASSDQRGDVDESRMIGNHNAWTLWKPEVNAPRIEIQQAAHAHEIMKEDEGLPD